ncbi:WD40/YVTN/BNR-like repeat-containing protein [Alkalihalobacterium elongatum]|uniref:WD40/YVTN/BNR-like repeat-containing protein n=1 Tax=Alkalihalobacterium elongatum TaxID=2675466 RepID=UPI001C1FEEFB|nr:sialidase family protein [Alkalihalobacterium elongatum]
MEIKQKRILLVIILIFMVSSFVLLLNTPADEDEDNEHTIQELDETSEVITEKLPYTVEVNEWDIRPENIAYRVLFDLMKSLESDGIISNAAYIRFTRLQGDENEFVVAVVMQVLLPDDDSSGPPWMPDYDVTPFLQDIVWILTIEKGGDLTYSLTNIEKTDDRSIGLPLVQSMEEYLQEIGMETPVENIGYQLTEEALQVTYNNGESWLKVPVETEALYGLRDRFNSQLLMGSYILSNERTAFLLQNEEGAVHVIMSTDNGKTWEETPVSSNWASGRFGKIEFTTDQDGYLIFSGERTMGFEAHFIYKTNDGGKSWYNAGFVEDTHQMVTDGGFINDQLGFMSFGYTLNEDQAPTPHFYRTENGGDSWEQITIPIPEEYKGFFTVAEMPTFQGGDGTLVVNQGAEGDYLGGKVLAKFTSHDEGKTWSFAGLVDPNGVLE